MAASPISLFVKRSFGLVVIFPIIITGLAISYAALPLICLYGLAALSGPLKAGEHHGGFLFPSVQPLPPDDLRSNLNAAFASLAEGQQDIQSTPPEAILPSQQPLLRRNVPSTGSLRAASYRQALQFISLAAPTLAPMAFTRFCLNYPSDCKSEGPLFGSDRIALDKVRRSELESINQAVNTSIFPQRNENGPGETWMLSPARGNCNDYAVTKRHQLIARGWPARTVLLSEVVIASGEHHLVTVVRTDGGDLVLDNLTDEILPWSRTPYRWLRMQTPTNPNYWAAISEQATPQAIARRQML